MFTAALFSIAKTWKQPKCPSMDKRTKAKCGLSTLWNVTQPKKEENPDTCYHRTNLEDIMLSDIIQTQKDKYCVIPLYGVPGVIKFIVTESRMVLTRAWGKRGLQSEYLMGTVFHFGEHGNALEMDGGDGRTTM